MNRTKKAISLILSLLLLFALVPTALFGSAVDLSNEYRLLTSGSFIYNVPLGITASQLMASVYSTAVLKTADGTVVANDSETVVVTGMTLSYTYVEYTLVVLGDLNSDGLCSVTDFLLLKGAVAGDAATEIVTLAGDMDADGRASPTDVLIMTNYITGEGNINSNCYLTEEEKAAIVLGEPDGVEFTNQASIHFDGETVTASGEGVTVVDNYAYVTAAGNYTVTGTGTNGYVHVCAGAEEHVSLTLSGASITNTAGPAIYFEQCKKAYVCLADGTASTLADGTVTTLADKGALFSNDTLSIEGTGSLTVTGNRQHGIASDDDIIITDASLTVTGAVKDALHANDDITVNSGSLTVQSAGSDALESEGTINVNGGTLTLTCDAGTALKAGTVYSSVGGTVNVISSADGIKAGTDVNITDGTYSISTVDNAIKATANANVLGGSISVLSSDTGIKGDAAVNISGGTQQLNSSNNAVKSDLAVNISGGDLTIVSAGDGIKARSASTTATTETRTSFTYDSLNGSIESSGCYIWDTGSVSSSAVYWHLALASSNGDGTFSVTEVIDSGTAKTFTASADQIAILTYVNHSNYSSAVLIQKGDLLSYNTSTKAVTVTVAAYTGSISITGGNQHITAAYDCTHAGENLTIDNTDSARTSASGIGSGSYNLYAVSAGGANASFDSTAGSFKAIKADNNVIINNVKLYASSPEDAISSDVYIEINAGTLYVESGRDGVAVTDGLCINGGVFNITTGGGYSNTISSSDTNSYKALKGNGYVIISGGTFTVNSSDDAVHSNGACTINGGTFSIYTGDDAFHSDTTMTVSGGDISIHSSYEGVEGLNVNITGGSVIINSSDDGINAAGGADGSGTGTPTRPGQGGMGPSSSSSSSYSLNISGTAWVWMNTHGDGADSNGSLTVSGGTLIIQQSQSNADSGIDADGSISIKGGVVVMVDGGNNMNSFSSSNFSQPALEASYSGSANTLVALTNSSGTLLLAYKPTVSYSRLLICTPEMSSGNTYKLYTGGSCSGTATQGFYESGTYTVGTLKKSFSVSSNLTSF